MAPGSTEGGGGVLRRAHELGAAFVDTAEVYGTEAQVARDIGDLRDEYFIATKVSPANLAYDDVLSHADASLERLETDRIDLYQVHHPNPDIPIPETMRAMRQTGRARARCALLGVSNYSVDDMKESQDALGDVPLVANQVRYSLAARQIEADGAAVLPGARRDGHCLQPAGKRAASGIQPWSRLAEVAAEVGKTPAQVLLNWVVDRPARHGDSQDRPRGAGGRGRGRGGLVAYFGPAPGADRELATAAANWARSAASSTRAAPGGSLPRRTVAIRRRRSFATSAPTAANIRRIW